MCRTAVLSPCVERRYCVVQNRGTIHNLTSFPLRLTGSSGVVVDHIGGNWYKDDSQCLVLIEANR